MIDSINILIYDGGYLHGFEKSLKIIENKLDRLICIGLPIHPAVVNAYEEMIIELKASIERLSTGRKADSTSDAMFIR